MGVFFHSDLYIIYKKHCFTYKMEILHRLMLFIKLIKAVHFLVLLHHQAMVNIKFVMFPIDFNRN